MLLNTCVKSPSRGDGRNESFGVRINERTRFQSTRPSWGATRTAAAMSYGSGYFNPRAPRGARQNLVHGFGCVTLFQSTRPSWGATAKWPCLYYQMMISIHAPLVGRDRCRRTATASSKPFQSTRPSWGATRSAASKSSHLDISIHAPLVGRDAAGRWSLPCRKHFNPRAPRGARLSSDITHPFR